MHRNKLAKVKQQRKQTLRHSTPTHSHSQSILDASSSYRSIPHPRGRDPQVSGSFDRVQQLQRPRSHTSSNRSSTLQSRSNLSNHLGSSIGGLLVDSKARFSSTPRPTDPANEFSVEEASTLRDFTGRPLKRQPKMTPPAKPSGLIMKPDFKKLLDFPRLGKKLLSPFKPPHKQSDRMSQPPRDFGLTSIENPDEILSSALLKQRDLKQQQQELQRQLHHQQHPPNLRPFNAPISSEHVSEKLFNNFTSSDYFSRYRNTAGGAGASSFPGSSSYTQHHDRHHRAPSGTGASHHPYSFLRDYKVPVDTEMKVMKFDLHGEFEPVLFNPQLLRGISPRDLNYFMAIEPNRSGPVLLPRRECVILCMGGIKAVIFADSLLLLNIDEPTTKTYIHVIAEHLRRTTPIHDTNTITGDYHYNFNYSSYAFEMRCLDILLRLACNAQRMRLESIEQTVNQILRDMFVGQLNSQAVQRVYPLKDTLYTLEQTGYTLGNMLKSVIISQADMMELFLTIKWRYRQMTYFNAVMATANDENPPRNQQQSGQQQASDQPLSRFRNHAYSHPTTASPHQRSYTHHDQPITLRHPSTPPTNQTTNPMGSDGSAPPASTSPPTQQQQQQSDQQNTANAGPTKQADQQTGQSGFKLTTVSPPAPQVTHEQHRDVELLLESYEREAIQFQNAARLIRLRLQTVEDFARAYRSNEAMSMHASVDALKLALSAAAMIAAIFGMNLTSSFESHPTAFYWTVFGLAGASSLVYLAYLKVLMRQLQNSVANTLAPSSSAPLYYQLFKHSPRDMINRNAEITQNWIDEHDIIPGGDDDNLILDVYRYSKTTPPPGKPPRGDESDHDESEFNYENLANYRMGIEWNRLSREHGLSILRMFFWTQRDAQDVLLTLLSAEQEAISQSRLQVLISIATGFKCPVEIPALIFKFYAKNKSYITPQEVNIMLCDCPTQNETTNYQAFI